MDKEALSSTTLTKGLMLMETLAEAGSPIDLSELPSARTPVTSK